MPANSAYLLECVLYEKCLNEKNNWGYIAEFQRAFPNLFEGPFTMTPAIEELDADRKGLVQQLNEISDNDERYGDFEDAIWFTFQYEVKAFYEANQTKLGEIIDCYEQFLRKDDKKEELIFKIVCTPAGYWFTTKHQSWLLALKPFRFRYTCKVLGIYLYWWIKSVLKGWQFSWKHSELQKARIGI